MRDDGSIPSDNPVIPGNNVVSSIYSYGHRNPQGVIIHPETNEIWETEHGPKGGDEVNIITRGANYGWPVYSIGVNYDGVAISSGHSAPGIAAPCIHGHPQSVFVEWHLLPVTNSNHGKITCWSVVLHPKNSTDAL